jgi:hypothetical protein
VTCYFCKKNIPLSNRVGRQDRCPHCGGDLHICKNCRHYDITAYNECRETQAESVLDKEASNFCDYFSPTDKMAEAGLKSDPATEAKRKLKEMFRK